MKKTKINWSEVPWNPASGATKSLGCKLCYTEVMPNRLKKRGKKAETVETPAHQVTIKKQNINND